IGDATPRGASEQTTAKIGRGLEQMSGPGQPRAGLEVHAAPTGDVGDQRLEHPRRALAAPVVDGSRDVDSTSSAVEGVDHAGRDQLTEPGELVVVGELDEVVVPQAVELASV